MALTQAELDAAQAQINAARNQAATNIDLAKGWSQVAQSAAEASGSGSAQVATAEANRAGQQRVLAETARTGAETARTGAETARTGAETARTGAETARSGAETARNAAESIVTGALMSEAEATAGTATTGRLLSAATLKGAIQRWATGSYSTAISAIGQALNRATDAAAARDAIGAGTSNLTLGTTASTARAGNWVPTKADVGLGNVDNTSDLNKPISTATQAALDGKAASDHTHTPASIGAEPAPWQGTQSAYDALGAKDPARTYYIL